ncbi:MAG: hypothetical protein IKM70_00105 [Firmicutes bacterium]|nr:hypothetical protein [Bacillota bacterium]
MKKYIIAVILMLALLLSACSEESKRDALPFTAADQLYAVAWLGYGEMRDLEHYQELYLDSKEAPPLYFFSGAEYYLVIPRYADAEVQLYRNDLATMSSELLYTPDKGEAFILQCNVSDIFPDATVRITHNGQTVEFRPHISLKDGSLEIGDHGINISK